MGAHDLPTHDRLVRSCLTLPVWRARSNHQALPFCGPCLCDPDVKVNDVQRFTTFAAPMLWPSITHRGITRMQYTFAVKTEADSERHRAPHKSLPAWFPFRAWVTSSLNLSEAGNSCTATKERKSFTGVGR